MDFAPLLGPAVVAAGVSGIISVIGLIVSTRTARALNKDKLEFDERLAERKFEADKELAERKFSFDKELAERRFKYDRDLHSHKRLTELAEVLADFYEARDDINAARSPGGFSSEGRTRPRGPDESEDDTATLNSYYSVAERLSKRTEFFSRLEARRYRFIAHFGLPAAEPYANPSNIEAWRGTIWQIFESDPTPGRLEAMVEAMERTCRPAIEESAR